MTQFALDSSIGRPGLKDEVMVAIDLETSGLDSEKDRIIEVGAVRFRGRERIATYSTLVNPNLRLDPTIVALTNIAQSDVDAAPQFSTVAPDIETFIGEYPLVGHRVSFDLGFLKSHGIRLRARAYDTFDLASVVVPRGPEYGLAALSARFKADHDNPHRALSDALATQVVFAALLEGLNTLDSGVLAQLVRLGREQGWGVSDLASRVLEGRTSNERRSMIGPLGVDERALSARIRPQKWSRGLDWVAPTGIGPVKSLFERGGPLAQLMPGYELRPQQVAMAEAAATAIESGEHLIVEAGTGVGKSLAYLIPAALHALAGKGSVVVSTNTINLQQQLIDKDIPAVRSALATLGIEPDKLRVAQLKGRSNYLCFRRWAHAQVQGAFDVDSARFLGKCLVWLQTSSTGDRGELGMDRRDHAIFSRYSSQGAAGCPAAEGPCFLRRARTEAQAADIIIVNHALLLSDLAMGGGIIPEHSALVIDEAHHLETVATRHLGFSVIQSQHESQFTGLEGEHGIVADVARTAQLSQKAPSALNLLAPHTSAVLVDVERARRSMGDFHGVLGKVVTGLLESAGLAWELRITTQTRAQPGWSNVEVAWENHDLTASRVAQGLRDLSQAVARTTPESDEAVQAVQLNLAASIDAIEETRGWLRQAVAEPSPNMIYWLAFRSNDGTTNINAAPLDVAPLLKQFLFDRERSVILTSGTLASDGTFKRLRQTLGVEGGKEIALGSPFDFSKAALLAVPSDIPEPNAPGYNRAIADAIGSIALATRERTLVLFTSNSSLQAVRDVLREPMRAAGIRVVGQGPDGPPSRIMRALAEAPETVALGASSLWEGVDLDGVPIKTLIVARLPFPVPTDPIFAARSDLHEDPFGEYTIPEAVQRLRQGFGRLIRNKTDRGACVILDRRLTSKAYGIRFTRALPGCTMTQVPWRSLGTTVNTWIKTGRSA